MTNPSEGDMVERVAWAILGGLSPDAGHEDSLKVARAAIEAMLEPTDAVLRAAGMPNRLRAEEHWKAMIQAALSHPEGDGE